MSGEFKCILAIGLGYAFGRWREADASGVPVDIAFKSPLTPVSQLATAILLQRQQLAKAAKGKPAQSEISGLEGPFGNAIAAARRAAGARTAPATRFGRAGSLSRR